MVAQGATVAVLIASAGLSQIKFKDEEDEEAHNDKQWQDIVSRRTASELSILHADFMHTSIIRSISHKNRRHPWDVYILRTQAGPETSC